MIIKRFVSLFSTTSFKVIAFLVLLITSVMIALAMLLGKEAGNFVIRVQDGVSDKSISLSTGDPKDSSTWKSKLEADGMTGMTDYTASYFVKLGYSDLNAITKSTGIYTREGNSLYAYTFYIVNTSPSGNVGVNLTLNYSGATKSIDKAIRVMTYAQESTISTPEIYMAQEDESLYTTTKIFDEGYYETEDEKFVNNKTYYLEDAYGNFTVANVIVGDTIPADTTYYEYKDAWTEEVYEYPYSDYILEPKKFSGDGKVFENQYYMIGQTAGEEDKVGFVKNYLKYSVFFWLEGKDPECDERILGGSIKFDLTVQVAD